MARKQSAAGSESLDWYLISVQRLKQLALVVFIVLVGGGVWWYINREHGDPRSNAEAAIADAKQALDALASSREFAAHKGDFERARKKLDDASALFASTKYPQAQAAAVEAQTIARASLSGGAEQENDVRFITIEGDVQYQKAPSSDWKRADTRVLLYNGDWVRTGDSASAELMFQSNGSVYTIGPNALLEIYAALAPGSGEQKNAVHMQVGSVEVATSNESSTVRTPATQVTVDSESTTQIGVEKSKATAIMTVKGTSSVASASGGTPVKLTAGEKLTASSSGALGTPKKLILPPALSDPGDNEVFTISPDSSIDFSWQPSPGASAYQLQVSRSRLFSTLEINSRRQKTSATARVTSEGTFYWRIAAYGPDGDLGPASPFRRFRVSGGTGTNAEPSTDRTPPVLTLKAPFNLGGQFFMIEGTTEPGATVFVADEEVEVESNGHFKKLVSFNKLGPNAVVVKAVDPAGNQTVKSQTVLVEE